MEYGIRPPGYRLPDATHIGRVVLQVSDLSRSLEYYEVVLGLRIIERSGNRAMLGPHGDDTVILELREKKGARTVPRRGLLGLYHFAILLPDRPTLGRFVAHLANLGVQPGMSDHFVSEAIYLQDPDNLGIEVYRDRPRSEWRQENGQLSMTTIPLDVTDVIASAQGADWTGMPAGTRIGHVHLHVGDIDQAATFYHDALGLDKQVWNYPGALFLSAGGYHHHLGTNTWARGAPSATDDDAKLVEWQLIVPSSSDVRAATASLERATKVEADGDSVIVADPWGTTLRIAASQLLPPSS
jgi:catechol 2,3-dioxygenase